MNKIDELVLNEMSMMEKLLARTGRTKVPRYAKEEIGYRGRVAKSNEFMRIAAIPRREWNIESWLLEVTQALTEELKTPDGYMTLWPIQAAALHDITRYKGALLPIGVGQGKALISLLAAIVMEAKKPLLIVPASLRDQTKNWVIPRMQDHWKIHPNLTIIGYSELSLEKNKDLLWDLKPDLIILDECHSVARKKAGRTRRLVRYFREFPDTNCVAMSGTVSKRSLKDWAHIAEWCLRDRTPLPRKWPELAEWADAIDEDIPPEKAMAGGALKEFCQGDENVRQGFRRRLVETPGVVASHEDELGSSLLIQRVKDQIISAYVSTTIEELRTRWETPNGDIITSPLELYRHIRELALGFWYRWNPPAPRDWLDARREWKRFVRDRLRYSRSLDTELQIWNEAKAANTEVWRVWAAIKDTFKINQVAEWIDYTAICYCLEWLEDGGICWVSHPEFGKMLSWWGAKVSQDYPYFGAGDNDIIYTDKRSIIASIKAHGQGKNLERYARNLVTSPPQSGNVWEQLLGRTHREGQQADTVTVDVMFPVNEILAGFIKAQNDARYLEDTYGNRQKLNYADIVL